VRDQNKFVRGAGGDVSRKFPRGRQSFVKIVWRHKSTLRGVPKARPFSGCPGTCPRENFAKLHLTICMFVHSGSKFQTILFLHFFIFRVWGGPWHSGLPPPYASGCRSKKDWDAWLRR